MSATSASSSLNDRLDTGRLGALFCLLLSVVGVTLCAALTVEKFRATYTPCLAELTCPIDDDRCVDALSSSGSVLFGLPISVWGASVFVVVGVLAVGILWRGKRFGIVAPQALFLLACLALLVGATLGAYSTSAVTAPCSFCMSLYGVLLLLAGGAHITRSPPGNRSVEGLGVLRRRLPDTLDLGFLLAVWFTVATGVQSMTYHGLRNFVDRQIGCPEVVATWPQTKLRLGAREPQAIISLFIDLTDRTSGDKLKEIASALYDGKFPAPVQIRLYHSPREACDPSAFASGYAKAEESTRADGACLAARAAECIENLHPGAGVELVGGMFALHEDREDGRPLFTEERITRRATELRLLERTSDEGQLHDCIRSDKAVLAHITAHQLHAAGPEFRVPMLAIHRALDGAPDLHRVALWADSGVPLSMLIQFVSAQVQEHAEP